MSIPMIAPIPPIATNKKKKPRLRMTQDDAIDMSFYMRENWERITANKMTYEQAARDFSTIQGKEFSPVSIAAVAKKLKLVWPTSKPRREVTEERKKSREYKMTKLAHNVEALRKFQETIARELGIKVTAKDFGYDDAIVHRIVSHRPLLDNQTATS